MKFLIKNNFQLSTFKNIFQNVAASSRFYSNEAFKSKPSYRNSPGLQAESDKSKRPKPTTAQIEQYKTQLYDLIMKKREPEQAILFSKTLLESFEPNLHLFNVVLKGHLMLRNVDGIKETLLLIAKNNLAFNSITLNLLLVYYRDLNMMEEAEKLFKAIENRKTSDNPLINCAGPNLSAYTTMISGWARNKDFGKAREYFDKIEADGLVADEQAISSLLTAAVSLNHLDEAKKLYESIVSPNFVTEKIWLRASLRLGGFEEGLKRVLKFKESSSASFELSEMFKWVESDLSGSTKQQQEECMLMIFSECLKAKVRLGDPRCIHYFLDFFKASNSVSIFEKFTQICLTFSDPILPILSGRLVHHLIKTKKIKLAGRVVEESKRLRIVLPESLIKEYAEQVQIHEK